MISCRPILSCLLRHNVDLVVCIFLLLLPNTLHQESSKMCHGHPHYHPCSHTSVKWLYCPEAMFDLDTGYETPCSNPIYSTPQPTNVDCPLQNCNFKALMGSWNCCVCRKGPNTQGWCTALVHRMDWNPLTGQVEDMEVPCGHGCCSSCSPSCEKYKLFESVLE